MGNFQTHYIIRQQHKEIFVYNFLLIYIFTLQVDGGSENTAKAALAICELLVARRLTRRLILSRLLVGHTHEDIDAIFAIIWQFLKNKKVMTPQIYADLLAFACQNKAKSVDVIDLSCQIIKLISMDILIPTQEATQRESGLNCKYLLKRLIYV